MAVNGSGFWRTLFGPLQDRYSHWRAAIVRDPKRSALAALTLIVVAAVVFGLSIQRLNHFAEMRCDDGCVFGSDANYILKDGSKGYYEVAQVRPHAAVKIFLTVTIETMKALGINGKTAFIAAIALANTALAALLLLLVFRLTGSLAIGVATAAFVFSANGVLVSASVPEFYTATCALICLSLLVFVELEASIVARPIWSGIVAGLVAGGAGLANTPAAAIAVAYSVVAVLQLRSMPPVRRLAVSIALPCAIAILLALTPQALKHDHMGWTAQNLSRWGSFGNILDGALMRDYVADIAVFSWVSPIDLPQCRLILQDLALLLTRPLAIAAYLGTVAFSVWALLHDWKQREVMLRRLGVFAALFVLLSFYVYFNPYEAMLYAPQWTLLISVALVSGLRARLICVPILALLSVLLFFNNDPLKWPTRVIAQAECCGPDRERLPPAIVLQQQNK